MFNKSTLVKFAALAAVLFLSVDTLAQGNPFNGSQLENEVQQGTNRIQTIVGYVLMGIGAIATLWTGYQIFFQKNDARQSIVWFIVGFVFIGIGYALGLI